MALAVLGRGFLNKSGNEQEAVALYEALVAAVRRNWPDNRNAILQMKANLAAAYEEADRLEESIALKREGYLDAKAMAGPRSELALALANNLAVALMTKGSYAEARTLLKAQTEYQGPDAPLDNELTLSLLTNYAKTLHKTPDAVPDDLLEAIATYEKCLTAARRVYGPGHPYPKRWEEGLEIARAALAAPKSARFERALKRARKD